jgi:predicted transglutaminase-like protease
MKYRIADLTKFNNSVFGADCLLEIFPELTTTGVNLLHINDYFYVVDDNNNINSNSAFFTQEELHCLEQVK